MHAVRPAAAADQNRRSGRGSRELCGKIVEIHVVVVGEAAADADIFLDIEGDAVHFTCGEMPCAARIALRLADLILQLVEPQDALEAVVVDAVAHREERIVAGGQAVLVEIVARQRVDAVALIGEILHVRAEAAAGLLIGRSRTEGARKRFPQRIIIEILLGKIPAAAVQQLAAERGICDRDRLLAAVDLRRHRRRVIPDLRAAEVHALPVGHGAGRGVEEIRLDGVVLRSGIVDNIIKIVFRLAVGRTDVVGAVRCEELGGLFVVLEAGKLHRARGADRRAVVRVDLIVALVAQLGVAAVEAVVIQAVLLLVLVLTVIQQNERTVAVNVVDLDAAVLNELRIEGIDAEIHRAHRAGEDAEMIGVAGLLDCKVERIVEAAEQTAAHLHVARVDRDRRDAGLTDP